jgi:hypothetical protein
MSASTCAPWATAEDACSPCDTYDFDPFMLEDKMQIASDVLFNLTGRRWPGVCSDTIRPTELACGCWNPRAPRFGCSTVPTVKLPGSPVVAVTSVRVDGVELDASAYRVDNRRELVRIDGEGWPCCQDMRADPATDDHTMLVEYTWGAEPPLGGVQAAATYGCQLALACDPEAVSSGRCRLPKRITTVTRAGTTIAVLDPMTLVKDGLVGLNEVDTWVQSILLGDSRRRSRVLVPGARRSARRTS